MVMICKEETKNMEEKKTEYKSQICNDCKKPSMILASKIGMESWVCKVCFKNYK